MTAWDDIPDELHSGYTWFKAREVQRYCNTVDFVQTETDILQANVVMASTPQPRNAPLLVVDTVWYEKDGGPTDVPTLVDTGCTTSIIHSNLLGLIRSVNGEEVEISKLVNGRSSLTAASGDGMTTEHACTATFIFQGRTITHTMFVLDNLACKQKLLLGMDFMNDHGLTINIDRGTITFPDSQMNTITADVESMGDVTALHCMQTVIVQKGKTIGLTLKPGQGRTLEEGLIGFIYAHPRLQHGLILWEGVQVVDDGNIIACVTNTTDEDVELLNDTPMAMWDTSDEQDFEWADTLDREINAVVNALRVKPSKGKSKDEPIVVASSDDEQEDEQENRMATKQRSVRQHHNTADSTSHHKTAAERVSRWVATHPTCNALEA